jgi:hypothetical protein
LRARGCDSFAGQDGTSENLDSSAAAFKHIADGSRKEVGICLGRGRIEKAVKSVFQIGKKFDFIAGSWSSKFALIQRRRVAGSRGQRKWT